VSGLIVFTMPGCSAIFLNATWYHQLITTSVAFETKDEDLDVMTLWCYVHASTKGGDIMAMQTKRATVYLDTELHKALRLKAVETSRSVSELVNYAVREALAEDADDIAVFGERIGEPLIAYDEMVKKLRKNGLI